MELTVAIPVYNFDIGPLLSELRESMDAANTGGEIVVMDDASGPKWQKDNARAARENGAIYRQLDENIGRSAIRNRLAEEAKGRQIIFMDCDMRLPDRNFVSRYLRHAGEGVVAGGHIYGEMPADPEKMLHWCYGTQVESRPATERNNAPYRSFMTGNFMIPKASFKSIRFDESIQGYGHEDTLFGLELKRKGIPILHIDNPLIHSQIESNDRFIEKNREAVRNLMKIYLEEEGLRPGLIESVRLLSVFERIRSAGLLPLFRWWATRHSSTWEQRLKQPCGRKVLRTFSLLKLHWAIEEYREQKKKGKS